MIHLDILEKLDACNLWHSSGHLRVAQTDEYVAMFLFPSASLVGLQNCGTGEDIGKIGMDRMIVCGGVKTINFMIQTGKSKK